MIAAVLLLAGAAVVLWPGRVSLSRRRPTFAVRDLRQAVVAFARRQPRRAIAGGVAGATALGLLFGGPVGAVVAAAYAALAARALLRRASRRRVAAERSSALDELATLAADLRAGLPPVSAGSAPASAQSPAAGRIVRLTSSVWRLAEQTGAPAADLVERIEADARAADRGLAKASAQNAGSQATALLLTGMPVGGVGMGIGIGADPVHVLLHTTVGAGCALAAMVFQAAGVLWSERLTSGGVR